MIALLVITVNNVNNVNIVNIVYNPFCQYFPLETIKEQDDAVEYNLIVQSLIELASLN